mmetsp:Transcript_442/g.424  ORF Transcript_442/g.424 Transcript_442/m.424 type:complete len:96 (-) Transcript_442:739-1026(-)
MNGLVSSCVLSMADGENNLGFLKQATGRLFESMQAKKIPILINYGPKETDLFKALAFNDFQIQVPTSKPKEGRTEFFKPKKSLTQASNTDFKLAY